MRDTITDIDGLLVGQAQDATLKSGVTVLAADRPFTAAVHVMGGAPGTRETDLLAPDKTVQQVDALVLSGGSGLGLAAGDGVASALKAAGRGFDVGGQKVPIVPGAIIFDLLAGGDHSWTQNPYPDLGRRAYADLSRHVAEGSVGAGMGATTATLKGGLGTACMQLPGGVRVGAIVAVNALGGATVDDGPHFWAAPWEQNAEFGGKGVATTYAGGLPATKLGPAQNTTIAIVATDARLDKSGCLRMATAAHDGMARALVPSHTPMDGDLVFGVSHGDKSLDGERPSALSHAAATVLARAIARGVYHATSAPGDVFPTWQERFA